MVHCIMPQIIGPSISDCSYGYIKCKFFLYFLGFIKLKYKYYTDQIMLFESILGCESKFQLPIARNRTIFPIRSNILGPKS